MTANGPVFPGRNNSTATAPFLPCKGGDSPGAPDPGTCPMSPCPGHTAASPLDTASAKGPESCCHVSLSICPLSPTGTSTLFPGLLSSSFIPPPVKLGGLQHLLFLFFIKAASTVITFIAVTLGQTLF